eukprot:s1949_g13.t3
MEFIPAACCCVTYSMFRSSVLTLSSDRLCGRIRGVGRSLEQRLALLKADLRRLSDPKQRLMPCVWDAWVGFTRQARKRQQPALQMREVQRTAFAAARCLRAWAEAARPLRQAGTADQMAAKSLHPALERLAAGLYELERSSAAKESELLRLATRLSRALFEELQDARHSLAYAQERLSHLQILVANDRRKQMGHGSLTQAAAKDFNGWVGDQKSGLHQSTMHRLIYAIFMSLQLQASTSPGAAKSPGITKLCRTRNRVQLHPTPLPRMICACGVSCSDHQRLRRSPPAPRRLLAHLCAAGGLGGCELRRFLRSCARPPQPALRIARRRAQRRLQGRLREEGFRLSPSPFSSDGFFVAAVDELNCQAPTLGRSLAHRRGEVYGQETTSTLPVEVLGAALRRHQISPEYVLDLCAAPGSKATQLMSQLPSGTVLIANEFREDRARLLRANLLRSGACQALVSSLDGRRFGELCPEAFDAILVDAPCSGEGNIRKDPKAFDRWSGCDSLRLEASAPQLQMANEEHQDLTHLEKLKANSAGGRMENVMKGSIERFRSSTTRRKQEVAQLEDHSDEENSPVAGERASKDPTPRSRLMEHEDSSEINQPIWHSHPDILPPSEAQDSPEDLRGCRTLPRTPRLPAALMLRKSLASTPDKRQHVVAFIQALLKMVTSWLVATSLKKYAYLRENMPDAVEERLPFVWTCFALLEKLQFGYCILSTNVSGAKKLWAIKRTRETAGPELQLFDVPIGEYSATPGRRLFENSRPPLPCLYRSPIQLVQNHCESIQAGVSLSGSVVLQATRLWNAPLEEKGTLIPMRDIDERLGVSVGMILSHLNRDHAPVQSAVAFIESHLVDAWFYTDIGSGQRRMRIPPVALPTFSLDAAADGEGNVDFYLLHVRHGDYHILLTCCEVDLRAWHLLADGASAPNSIEMQVLRTQYCPVYRRCCGSDHASYVAGEVENDTKKPKVLDYFSTTSAYCFNDEKFRPIKSMEPGASRSPKASFDHEIEIDGERYAEDPDPTLHEKIDSKERKQRAKTAAKAKPKQPVKPKNELKAWEVASRRQGRSLHGECTWRHCERRSDDARPRTGQSYQGPRSLEQARAGQRPTACCTAVRACPGGWNVEAAGWIWRC